MIKIHPKPKKWLKYPETLKNDQKIMKPKNDKNTPKPKIKIKKKKKTLKDMDFLWTKMEDGHQAIFQITVNEE